MRVSEPTTQAMCSIRSHYIQRVILSFLIKMSLAMKLLSHRMTLNVFVALSAMLIVGSALADVNQGTHHMDYGAMHSYESGMMNGYGIGWMVGFWLPILLLMIIAGLVVWIITLKKK